jgi:NADH:ubiquinone oxidoreductase subunit 4 (chain M)
MDLLQTNLLSLILFLPAAGAALLLFFPRDQEDVIRWTALAVSLVTLGLTLYLWFSFDPQAAGFQFVENYLWFSVIGANYHLGVDGVSLPLVLLTALLTPLAVLFSFNVGRTSRRT